MENEMKASREKYWSECDPGEKADRMRRVVKDLAQRIDELIEKVVKLVDHEHGKDGRPLTHIIDSQRGLLGYASRGKRGDGDDVWF